MAKLVTCHPVEKLFSPHGVDFRDYWQTEQHPVDPRMIPSCVHWRPRVWKQPGVWKLTIGVCRPITDNQSHLCVTKNQQKTPGDCVCAFSLSFFVDILAQMSEEVFVGLFWSHIPLTFDSPKRRLYVALATWATTMLKPSAEPWDPGSWRNPDYFWAYDKNIYRKTR